MKETLHIYTRVSSTAQEERGTSLENQKELGFKKADELGFDVKLWNEGGQSSFYDDLSNRPVLVSLLSLIESGKVKHLFVYNTDRLSRNQKTWGLIRYKLLENSVTLHTVSGKLNLDNPIDDLLLGILSEISQYDNKLRSERSRLGRFQKIQEGSWKGGPPPFGYRLENKQLVIDKFESQWVMRIYGEYVTGQSVNEIRFLLTSNGVLTRRGNIHWSTGSIQKILKNTIYIGHYHYTDKSISETVRVDSPAIVEQEVFNLAQSRRQQILVRKQQVNRTKRFYVLRDLLVCGHCGLPMAGRVNESNHQNYYYCPRKDRNWKTRSKNHKKWLRGASCSMLRSINIERTNQLVWRCLDEVFGSSEVHQVIEAHIKNMSSDKIGESSSNNSNQNQSQVNDLINQNKKIKLTNSLVEWRDLKGSEGLESLTTPSARLQLDSLSDSDKRSLLGSLIEEIRVYFDGEENKHQLEIDFRFDIGLKSVNSKGRHNPDDKRPYKSDWVLLNGKGDVNEKKL